jgi:hypothetical protein
MPGEWEQYAAKHAELITAAYVEATERAQKAWTNRLEMVRELYEAAQKKAAKQNAAEQQKKAAKQNAAEQPPA